MAKLSKEYRAVDIDLHRTIASGEKSPALGPMLPGAAQAIRRFQKAGLLVYLSCGGFKEYGKEFEDKVRDWLREHGIDPYDHLLLSPKHRTVAVIDDRALCFSGDWKELVEEVLERAAETEGGGGSG